ncbi:MAG: AraC family transcriptional regulator [Lentisphaeraceae bacterium]|nr:AraC family transcriptional regulator [Lentisphaeraceae bacterium]
MFKKKSRSGFKGQKLVVLNRNLRQQILEDDLCRQLYFTDIGYFPHADSHYVKRQKGCLEYVIIFCFAGEGWCEYEGQRYEIHAGEYFILPPQEKHSYGSKDGSFWEKGWIHFSGDLANTFTERINKNGYGRPVSFKFRRGWVAHFNKMIEHLNLDLSYENVSYNCYQLWTAMGGLVHANTNRDLAGRPNSMEKVLKYMYENVKEVVALDELAAEAELSVSRFCVLFKKSMGQSAMDYLTELKIQQTCRLLSMTDWAIKDIAKEYGFDDQYYFSRRFKQKMGVSPRQFRAENFYS